VNTSGIPVFRVLMANWLLKSAGLPLPLIYSLLFSGLLCASTDCVHGQPLIHERISESIANRFTSTIPLKQCQYPRLWSDKTAALLQAHQPLQETHSDLRSDVHITAPSSSLPSRSTTQATRLFTTITEHYRALGHATPSALVVIESPRANAFIRRKTEVVLTHALLSRVTDESELAFILAHELAHIALEHTANGGIPAEVAADTLALQVMTALGFDPCSGSEVLERLGSPAQLTLVSVAPRLNALHDMTFDRCG
jgi:Zn-dependent protease with chaperone function